MYKIGNNHLEAPLVQLAELRGHLLLLKAFTELRAQIDALDVYSVNMVPFMPMDKDKRWVWFVGLAVERFTIWAERIEVNSSRPTEETIPPLDVLMVWHGYMLNPGWYAEDSARHSCIRNLTSAGQLFPIILATEPPLPLSTTPTNARVEYWHSRTHREFDPLEDARCHLNKTILCPGCRGTIVIPYLDGSGAGYLQNNFHTYCHSKGCPLGPFAITRQLLGLRKFADDFVGSRGDEAGAYLAGTVRTPIDAIDIARAQRLKDLFLREKTFRQPMGPGKEGWALSILDQVYWDFWRLREALPTNFRERSGHWDRNLYMRDRIMSAYAQGDVFSLDLIGAVIRQGSFAQKMRDLHWTEPEVFNSPHLQYAIVRYHQFLDLVASSPPSSASVPTLDIDLVWHTHQLKGEIYNVDCMTHVRRYIDHEDKIKEETISVAFDATHRAWSARFGIPYTQCDCPPPRLRMRDRFARLIHIIRSSNFATGGRHSVDLAILEATHPSEHNAVVFLGQTDTGYHVAENREAQRLRKEKLAARTLVYQKTNRSTDDGEREEGDGDPDGSKEHGSKKRGIHSHAAAFLYPIPLASSYHGYGKTGAYCAAHSGRLEPSLDGGGMSACAASGGNREIIPLLKPQSWNSHR